MANKEIVLCKMFTGDYWADEHNIGHETINMFIPDDQALAIEPISYMYLPASGDYKLEDHKITHVLLVRSVPDTDGKVVQIIGKAEVEKELLRNKDDSSKLSKCIGGKEFVGLHNLFKIFNPDIEKGNNINSKYIEEKLDKIAECYGKETPKNNEDYFNLAVDLGFRNDIRRSLSNKEFDKMLAEHQEDEMYMNRATYKGANKLTKAGIEYVQSVLGDEYKEKIKNTNSSTEYYYWYAKKNNWITETEILSDDDLMFFVKLYPDSFDEWIVSVGENEDSSYTFKKTIRQNIREALETREDLDALKANYCYAKKCLREINVNIDEFLVGAMKCNDFCKLVAEQYKHAKTLRGIFRSREQKKVRDTVYGGLTYRQIFEGNKHYGALNICASLKVKNLHLVDEKSKLYLKVDEDKKLYLSENKDSGNDID